MATEYGKTWWGQQWLNSLTDIDYENRIPRGKSYAQRGMVTTLKIKENIITAKVQGSRRTPYSVTVILPRFSQEQTDSLIGAITRKPSILSKLLIRQLDPEILEIAQAQNLSIFPRRWSDLKMNCSCPDWAVPCKHLAAVIYKMSMEIDSNPFLAFSMHGVDLLKELGERDIHIEQETLSVPRLSQMTETASPIRKRRKDGATDQDAGYRREVPRMDYSRLKPILEDLIGLLPASPAFCHHEDFRATLRDALSHAAKNALRILQGKDDRLIREQVSQAILRDTEASVVMTPELEPTFYLDSRATDQDDLTSLVMGLDKDIITDYQPSVQAIHETLLFSLHLIANGAVIPAIRQTARRGYRIIYQPASQDEAVRACLDEFKERVPLGLLGLQKTPASSPQDVLDPSITLLTLMLDLLIPRLTRPVETDDALASMFFKAKEEDFKSIGETQTPFAVKAWLDNLTLKSTGAIPLFKVDAQGELFHLEVMIFLDGPSSEPVPLRMVMTDEAYREQRFAILKQLSIVSKFMPEMDRYINQMAEEPIRFDIQDFGKVFTHILPTIQLLGARVLLPKSLQNLLRPKVVMQLSPEKFDETGFLTLGDVFKFNWEVALGETMLTGEEFSRLCRNANGLLQYKQGYIYVSEDELSRIQHILSRPPKPTSREVFQAALAEEFEGMPVILSPEAREMVRHLSSEEPTPLPKNLNATLRPYQERGYSWMYRNRQIGFGSILADDMGLGKTLQVITLLEKLREEGALEKRKALVVVPTGLLSNWMSEMRRFAPSLSAYMHYGQGRDLVSFRKSEAHVMLTTYGILRSDVEQIRKIKWEAVIIDEAQNIKNSDTAQARAIFSIPASCHIAMSGTPVENRLREFWSIMNFANKGYLGSLKDFQNQFSKPIQNFGDNLCAKRFRRITAPFIMRRLKTDKRIISDLPDKIVRNLGITLTPEQAALYKEVLDKGMEAIKGFQPEDGQDVLFKRQGIILQMILALKQVCNHPSQYLKNGDLNPGLSGKMGVLLDLVSSIVESREKVLIFTQFKGMGEIIAETIHHNLGFMPMFLHGGCSVPKRQEMVEKFQNNPAHQVFILSLKAAGTGLNLTAATHVIHYDLWWNPAVEQQATDRAYRIGQHSNVQVHRFITQNSFEERINEMIESKKALADMTVEVGENWIGKLSDREISDLFTLK